MLRSWCGMDTLRGKQWRVIGAEPVIENGKKLQQDFVEQILSGVDEEKRKKMAEILNQMEKNLDEMLKGEH